ncbi:cell division control protein 14 [Yamadazyma tenuis]|uniref:Tyrosine-protein phosphatase CDC14 n=1 Tax=Candida tenuis (strain ATCC 10573 / BCRC 21748 / CBS 615 / JCM 9827 / NBRC 10315 / NRRL Y-1498 / VKM Y-70) TaxID=590646 RepID=G3BBL3_CANTC|nr:protein tyrosine phosphatase CDC14 [Yamadazyma tenuis ATCC 10573]EGV61566.1 protein tyrosine phosphatase CDC14 [Yamadazyma tenuis ATCC 10573]WEJ92788.1 cell division control protein 14 [Yamadazyma tenuis]
MPKNKSTIPLIEFLKNRIYLGAYDHTPDDTAQLVYFTVEEALPYNSFHLDFGPLNIGSLYRFAVILHNILNEEANQGKAIVFYSTTGPKERANAACLLSCYMVLIQSWSPHQVLQPIAQIDPPLQGFRDAGYSSADFEITIQDVVYGMWRAKERGMIDLTSFNLEEYEQYERVDQGDFNMVSKDFVAFASPQQNHRKSGSLNEPFKKVLNFFLKNDVQLAVRLNSHLYDANEFTKRGIQHIDMIFDDGTCPTLEYVQKFIGAAECIINRGGKIAVHCKAGLGRTGCLIGAHLIYTHGFTANECIGYMRMIRPGMVVGPQQHWLYLHQNDFRDWRHTMCLDNRPDSFIGGLFPLVPYDEFKSRVRQEAKQRKLQNQQSLNSSVGHIDSSFQTPIRRRKISGALAAKIQTAVPQESPGQPRKINEENSGVVEIFNNSDDEEFIEHPTDHMQDVQVPNRTGTEIELSANDMNDDIRSSPNRDALRSISANQHYHTASQITKTTTKARTISGFSSSPQNQTQTHSSPLIKNKSRSPSRIGSGITQSRYANASPVRVISNGGVRKVSGSRKY